MLIPNILWEEKNVSLFKSFVGKTEQRNITNCNPHNTSSPAKNGYKGRRCDIRRGICDDSVIKNHEIISNALPENRNVKHVCSFI